MKQERKLRVKAVSCQTVVLEESKNNTSEMKVNETVNEMEKKVGKIKQFEERYVKASHEKINEVTTSNL